MAHWSQRGGISNSYELSKVSNHVKNFKVFFYQKNKLERFEKIRITGPTFRLALTSPKFIQHYYRRLNMDF